MNAKKLFTEEFYRCSFRIVLWHGVQGMNEIVGAIYYVLAKDWKATWAAEAEADAYYLFGTLLSEMRDVFMPDLDG